MPDTDTKNTLPSATESDFNSNLQTFLAEEDAERFSDMFVSFVVSGGTHATGSGLSHTLTTVAYPDGFYVSESATVTYPDSDTTWVAVHKDTVTVVGGNWTRVSGTHYLINSIDASQPSNPSGGMVMMSAVTSGGNVDTVTDVRVTSPVEGLSGGEVDETDTDTTKNKLVSNNLARLWENAKNGNFTTSLTLSEISAPSTPSSGTLELYATTAKELFIKDSAGEVEKVTGVLRVIEITVFDNDENCATGTNLALSIARYAGTITSVHAEVVGAGTTGTMTIDINIGGSSIFSTLLTIDSGETGSDTAATPAVISTSTLAALDRITVDVDGIHTTPAQGLVISLTVRPT